MINPASRDTAVKYAIENRWEEAYRENKKLLAENPNDLDTFNRIAHALIKLGKFKKAKEYYQKVIKADKTNPIALKNLKRLETISKGSGGKNISIQNGSPMDLQGVFIEEAGKTKTVDLKNVADKKTLSLLQPGDIVALTVKRSKIFVVMPDKTYIGVLPDNIGMRMITFVNGGNEYSVCIKAVADNSATVFLKEVKKMARFKNQPSFIHTPTSSQVLLTER